MRDTPTPLSFYAVWLVAVLLLVGVAAMNSYLKISTSANVWMVAAIVLAWVGGLILLSTMEDRGYDTDAWIRIKLSTRLKFCRMLRLIDDHQVKMKTMDRQIEVQRLKLELLRLENETQQKAFRRKYPDFERQQEIAAQERRRHEEMIVLGERSIGLFESMPKHLNLAEEHLDQAQADFADGAFAPFWDSIEKAANTLGRFNEGVHHINDNSSQYTALIKNCNDIPPEFPLARSSIEKLGMGTATAERMRAIVRNAQRNFQFAVIYEQRKTNQLLVAGFTSLAQALDQMEQRITASIDDLTSSVDVMTSTLNESVRAIHSRTGDIAETTRQHHVELTRGASEGAARERKALEMLDNIQRRRKPSL